MSHTDLVCLPLPHGFAAGDPDSALISLALLPRLSDGQSLTDHPLWLDWPQFLQTLTFGAAVNNTTVRPSELTAHVTADSAAWTAVFARPSQITTPDFDFDPPVAPGVDPRSYPQGEVTGQIRRMTRWLARRGGDAAPTVEQARRRFGADLGLRPDALREYLGTADPDAPVPPAADVTFGEAISLLLRHPQMARRLGLVVELELDLAALLARGIGPGRGTEQPYGIQVGCNAVTRSNTVSAAYPRVWATRDWWPAPNPSSVGLPSLVRDGQLNVGKREFDFGPGHGLLAALDLAHRLHGRDDDAPLPVPVTGVPPLELRLRDRAAIERARIERQAIVEAQLRFGQELVDSPEPQPAVDLFGEDVAATFRADILGGPHPTQRLRSLHERGSAKGYRVLESAQLSLPVEPDEGWVGTVWVDDGTGAVPKLPQSLLQWNGWSLSTLRPASAYDPHTRSVVTPGDGSPDPGDPIQFGVAYDAVAGSLPRLAYGHTYRTRVRTVDVAGNSIPNSDDGAIMSKPAFFGRFTPVPAPVVLKRTPAADDPPVGETASSIVLTSRPGQDMSSVPSQDRLLLPARSAPQEWELMDRPDDLFTPAGHTRMARLDVRRLDDQLVTDPITGDRIAGALDADGAVIAGPLEQIADILPDPTVRGVRATGMPQQREPILLDQPLAEEEAGDVRRRSTRMVVHAGDDAPVVSTDPADPGLHLWAPQAWQGRVRLSSTLDPSLAPRFAVFEHLGDVRSYVDGQHWMVSAQRRVEVLHAIPLPRQAPEFLRRIRVEREPWAVDATVRARTALDVAATGVVRLEAAWDEVVDDLEADGPTRPTRTVLLGSHRVEYEFEARREDVEVTYAFASTAARRLTVRADAIARWTEHFVSSTMVSFGDDQTQSIADGPVVATTVRVNASLGGRSYVEGSDYTIDATAGTITRLASGAIPLRGEVRVRRAEGTGRVPSADGPTPTVEVLVPSSAPPPAPTVTEVMPVHARQERGRGRRRTVRSDGRIVRIHLARPWFVSGEGEQLAVLIAPDASALSELSTIARDPRLDADVEPLEVRSFRSRSGVVRGVTAVLPDGTRVEADAVTHRPVYDEDRGEWVVDVKINTDAPRAAVRLVVCRLQRDAIAAWTDEDGALVDPRVSLAVELDTVRLGLRRDATVRRRRDGSATVAVSGPTHLGAVAADGTLRSDEVVVRVQERDPAISDPALAWRTVESDVLRVQAQANDGAWEGTIQPPQSSQPQRLVLEEHEPIVLDDGSPQGVDGTRPVWMEVLPLPAP